MSYILSITNSSIIQPSIRKRYKKMSIHNGNTGSVPSPRDAEELRHLKAMNDLKERNAKEKLRQQKSKTIRTHGETGERLSGNLHGTARHVHGATKWVLATVALIVIALAASGHQASMPPSESNPSITMETDSGDMGALLQGLRDSQQESAAMRLGAAAADIASVK